MGMRRSRKRGSGIATGWWKGFGLGRKWDAVAEHISLCFGKRNIFAEHSSLAFGGIWIHGLLYAVST